MPVAEDTRHQPRLRHVGVLVFVEEHRRETVAILTRDLGMLLDDVEGQLDLIAEVDHADLPLELPEDGARPCQFDALSRASRYARSEPMILELLEPLLVELDDLVGGSEVIGRLIVEGQDPIDHAWEPLGLDDLEGHPIEDPSAELDPLCRRQDPLVGLDPDRTRRGDREAGPRTRGSW